MENIASRREFVAGAVVAGAALVATGAAHADETAAEPDGYSFQETSTGLSVTVSDNEDSELPTVVLLATGGTIAGTGDAGKTTGYSAGELDVASLLASVPGIEELANVRGVQVCNISSTEMTSAYWVQMAKTINELAEDEAVSGFVETHGTDTLDETAYFLHLACKTDKPVVVTGAMRPATATSADGPMNLYQSIALAASPEAKGRGTMVVFSDGIYCGHDVQKVNTSAARSLAARTWASSATFRMRTSTFTIAQTASTPPPPSSTSPESKSCPKSACSTPPSAPTRSSSMPCSASA